MVVFIFEPDFTIPRWISFYTACMLSTFSSSWCRLQRNAAWNGQSKARENENSCGNTGLCTVLAVRICNLSALKKTTCTFGAVEHLEVISFRRSLVNSHLSWEQTFKQNAANRASATDRKWANARCYWDVTDAPAVADLQWNDQAVDVQ